MGLTRAELLQALNIVKDGVDLEAITTKAMVDYENEHWRKNLESAPHGEPWHVSFHASSFPGSEKACVRRLLYSVMDTPEHEPIPAKLRGQAEMGKAVEAFIISKWKFAGILLGEQVKFEDETLMLTGSADAILDLRPEYDAVLPVDIKSKDHNVIQEMQVGIRGYDQKHWEQLQAYMYFCALEHNYKTHGWAKMGLEVCRGAIIYYASRQDPTFSKQFYIEYDPDFIQNGLRNLELAKENLEARTIPPRPDDFMWSKEPCQWCPFKKYACKPDDKDGIVNMSESHAIEFSKHVRPEYDFEETMEKVEKRWS